MIIRLKIKTFVVIKLCLLFLNRIQGDSTSGPTDPADFNHPLLFGHDLGGVACDTIHT